MIGTQTPFRISFAGGGSDLPEFYTHEPDCVLSTTINKYMYIMVHPFFEKKIQPFLAARAMVFQLRGAVATIRTGALALQSAKPELESSRGKSLCELELRRQS